MKTEQTITNGVRRRRSVRGTIAHDEQLRFAREAMEPVKAEEEEKLSTHERLVAMGVRCE